MYLSQRKKNCSARGFTLIELLVVIAIIGLLSTVILSSLNAARARARDAQRKSNIVQIRTALEQYFLARGQYPAEAAYDTSMGSGATLPSGTDWDHASGIYTALVPTYLSALPVDPTNSGSYYYNYEPNGGGQGSCSVSAGLCEFALTARLETGGTFCKGNLNTSTGC